MLIPPNPVNHFLTFFLQYRKHHAETSNIGHEMAIYHTTLAVYLIRLQRFCSPPK